jgi:hypothetical protein
MRNAMTRTADRPAAPKRPYRAPTLKIHGNLGKLTAAKGGTNNDGSGKPNTKASGGNA